MKRRHLHLGCLALVAGLSFGPAFAKDHGEGNGHGNGHGHDRKEERHEPERHGHPEGRPGGRHDDVRPGAYFNDRHREFARRYYVEHYGHGRGCPPGLAKKHNGCMPPGHARRWRVGEPVPAGVAVYEVPRPVLLQLPPPPYGYHYARVGGDIVLVRNQGNLVIDIMLNVFG